jgi:hypothetical protein
LLFASCAVRQLTEQAIYQRIDAHHIEAARNAILHYT